MQSPTFRVTMKKNQGFYHSPPAKTSSSHTRCKPTLYWPSKSQLDRKKKRPDFSGRSSGCCQMRWKAFGKTARKHKKFFSPPPPPADETLRFRREREVGTGQLQGDESIFSGESATNAKEVWRRPPLPCGGGEIGKLGALFLLHFPFPSGSVCYSSVIVGPLEELSTDDDDDDDGKAFYT